MTASDSTLPALADLQWLRRLATALARDPDDADDLVQDTLVSTWSAPPVDPQQPLRPWLATVLRNRFRMQLRAQGRRQRREQLGASTSATTAEPDSELARLGLLRILLTELEALPPEDQKLVVRRFFEGDSAADIARTLAMPAATVRSRLHRSLQRLRSRLDARCGARSTWCAAILGAPPSPANPPLTATKASSMSLTAKFIVIAAASALGAAGWLAFPGSESEPVPPTAPEPSTQPLERAAASPPSPEPATPRAAWERRREAIRQVQPAAIAPPPPAAGSREASPLRALVRECLRDLDSKASGVVTISLSQIGAPDIGTIYDSVELVETTFADREVLECLTQSMYGWVGDPPETSFERRYTTTMVLGEPDGDVLKNQRSFEFIVGAHIREVQFCQTKADPDAPTARGRLTLEWSMRGGSGPAEAVRVLDTDLPRVVVDCIVKAGERWIFSEPLARQTHEYLFKLPIGADAPD